jgi:hypothetical protein
MKKFVLLILLLVTAMGSAQSLDGKIVILLVSEHRSGDSRMEEVKTKLLDLREKLGFSKEQMPIVFMGFADSDTERKYFDRLGFQAFDSPVLCVAEWGNPARFGPKRIVDYAIARSATPQHVDYIVEQYLKAVNLSVDGPIAHPSPSPTTTPSPGETGLKIVNVRFEASGKPLFLTNAGVRVKNFGSQTVRSITIRFYNRISLQDAWQFMGEKTLEKIPAGYVASRDVVGDTRDFRLVDSQKNAVRCFYKIEVEYNGNIIVEEGEFSPSEGPVGVIFNEF